MKPSIDTYSSEGVHQKSWPSAEEARLPEETTTPDIQVPGLWTGCLQTASTHPQLQHPTNLLQQPDEAL